MSRSDKAAPLGEELHLRLMVPGFPEDDRAALLASVVALERFLGAPCRRGSEGAVCAAQDGMDFKCDYCHAQTALAGISPALREWLEGPST